MLSSQAAAVKDNDQSRQGHVLGFTLLARCDTLSDSK